MKAQVKTKHKLEVYDIRESRDGVYMRARCSCNRLDSIASVSIVGALSFQQQKCGELIKKTFEEHLENEGQGLEKVTG